MIQFSGSSKLLLVQFFHIPCIRSLNVGESLLVIIFKVLPIFFSQREFIAMKRKHFVQKKWSWHRQMNLSWCSIDVGFSFLVSFYIFHFQLENFRLFVKNISKETIWETVIFWNYFGTRKVVPKLCLGWKWKSMR